MISKQQMDAFCRMIDEQSRILNEYIMIDEQTRILNKCINNIADDFLIELGLQQAELWFCSLGRELKPNEKKIIRGKYARQLKQVGISTLNILR